jgi:hypothetical protein
MRRAWDNVAQLVAPGGRLFISIYNDQGKSSIRWRQIKQAYNRLPRWIRPLFVVLVMAPSEMLSALSLTMRGRPQEYVRSWSDYKQQRGMSRWHDLVDWVGGYPFEVAKPEEVFSYFRSRGLMLEGMRTCGGGLGCNEFVFISAALER